MLTKKSIGIALVCALALGASGAAFATTVDGVNLSPNGSIKMTVNSLNLRETEVSAVGQTLIGYGQVGSIDGINGFCSGCDLTFTFTYNVSYLAPGTGSTAQAIFDSGNVQFYVSPAGTFDESNPASASMGTEWLTLSGHTGSIINFPQDGQLFSQINGTVTDPTSGSTGQGFLDVTGGPAAMYLNTATVADGIGGFADFSINSSFLFNPYTSGSLTCSDTPTTDLDYVCTYPIQGTAELFGKLATTSVPEPGELGLLGLGLGFLGLLVWRRRKESDKRA